MYGLHCRKAGAKLHLLLFATRRRLLGLAWLHEAAPQTVKSLQRGSEAQQWTTYKGNTFALCVRCWCKFES